jgi:hypothetical protein
MMFSLVSVVTLFLALNSDFSGRRNAPNQSLTAKRPGS